MKDIQPRSRSLSGVPGRRYAVEAVYRQQSLAWGDWWSCLPRPSRWGNRWPSSCCKESKRSGHFWAEEFLADKIGENRFAHILGFL